jgi:hypothetical protein
MNNATRRASCRLGFLLLCALPTLLLVSWILVSRSSAYQTGQKRTLEKRLTLDLGVDVQLESLSRLADGGWLLNGIRLTDPETGRLLASARLLEARHADGTLRIIAAQPEIRVDALHRLGELLHDRLLRDRDAATRSALLAAAELTLAGEDSSQTFTEVHAVLAPTANGPQLSVDFRLAGTAMNEPAQLRLVRNRQLTPPVTGWALHTGSTPLPCSLLADHLPALRHLGPDCHFEGSVWANLTHRGWDGDLSGKFLQLDLYNLVSEPFPHKLTGTAAATLNVARFEQGRLIEASGELRCPHGVVSHSLLAAARDHLQLPLNEDALSRDEPTVLFQNLALAFRLDEGGLTIAAVRDARQPGVLLQCDAGWLVAEPAAERLPVLGLVRTLVPDSQLQVPATRQTDPLLRSLPIPTVVVPPSPTTIPGFVPLRLRPVDR